MNTLNGKIFNIRVSSYRCITYYILSEDVYSLLKIGNMVKYNLKRLDKHLN